MMTEESETLKEAAAAIQGLIDGLNDRDAEILRIYEISSVLHTIATHYLNEVKPENADQQEAVDLVRSAVYALENNTTLSEAQLVAKEATEE